jgi:dTDP-4-dehydrorhamnose 3,5-epimerase
VPIAVKQNKKIVTHNRHGSPNGYLVPIFNVHDGFIEPEQYPQQVYLTVVSPGEIKGPHVHLKRWGLFTCIRGNGKVVVHTDAGYEEYFTGEDYDYETIQVPAGIPAALVNVGDVDAFFLNMPAPAWHPDDQDEHPVSFEDYFHYKSREQLDQ